ncbi:MAG: glycosyltransferase, partial [Pusillimonas sp.]|nr:glycosyltransferase [Pusillimonas sp.]
MEHLILNRAKRMLRAVYTRVSWGVPLVQTLKFMLHRTKALVSGSISNWRAITYLSQRRFNEVALATSLAPNALNRLNNLPEIDISVVSFNSEKWVKAFFDSLSAQSYPIGKLHVTIVDHGSTDGTLNEIKTITRNMGSNFAGFKLIQQPNLGFGAGHHRAIRESANEYCLVVNFDIEFLSDAILNAVQTALSDQFGEVASWEFRQVPYEHPKYYDPVTLETNWSAHACVLIRRSSYEDVGGYDERIFMYAEDVELSYRFRSFGYALKYVPSATVCHYTYEAAHQVKPVQYVGSCMGNMYVRLRYGNLANRLAAPILFGLLLLRKEPFQGARKLLLQNFGKVIRNYAHFRVGKGKGKGKVFFPFNRFDYGLRRDGAFYKQNKCLSSFPKVSVIIRTYNGRGFLLKQALMSVFHQTYWNIEVVVVEDGGDTQKEVVNALSARMPDNISLQFIAASHEGRSAAGNVGLGAATGQYLMFLDDDDLLFADHIETLVEALSTSHQYVAAYSLAWEVLTNINYEEQTYEEVSLA